jgi:hypothetical protein
MRRFGLVLAAAALVGAANTAEAQLSMQMGNGWNATFSGNVNAFYVYNTTDVGDVNTSKSNGIGTGLLPAFFTFDAKGKEGNTDVGVHFGFAPQVSSGGQVSSFFGTQAAGAQIDMRQVYATIGGTWGTVLFGKELGIFQRQNILQDMTLFGVGPNSLGRGTGLGRIGYGYLYTDFRGQFSYSTQAGKPFSLTFGVMEPIAVSDYAFADMPRFEAEITWKPSLGEKNNFTLFASGAYGHAKEYASDDLVPPSDLDGENGGLSSTGFAGGAKLDIGGFAITAAGFYAEGMGSLFMGDAFLGEGEACPDCLDANGDGQTTYGYYAQAMYTFPSAKFSFGAGYGGNYVDDDAPEAGDFTGRSAFVGQATYHMTKSTRLVAEFTLFEDELEADDDGATTTQFALGMMLFY